MTDWDLKNSEMEQNILDILRTPALVIARITAQEKSPTVKKSKKLPERVRNAERLLSESQNEVRQLRHQLDMIRPEPVSKFSTFEETKFSSQIQTTSNDEIYWKARYDHLNAEVSSLKADLKRSQECLYTEKNISTSASCDLRSSQDRSKRTDDLLVEVSCEKARLEQIIDEDRIKHSKAIEILAARLLATEERLSISEENAKRIRLLQESFQQETLHSHVKHKNLSISFGQSSVINIMKRKSNFTLSQAFSHWKTIYTCSSIHSNNSRKSAYEKREFERQLSNLSAEFQTRAKISQATTHRIMTGFQSLIYNSKRKQLAREVICRVVIRWQRRVLQANRQRLSQLSHQLNQQATDRSSLLGKISILKAQVESSLSAVSVQSNELRLAKSLVGDKTSMVTSITAMLVKGLASNTRRSAMKRCWMKWLNRVELSRAAEVQDRANYAIAILRSRVYRISQKLTMVISFSVWRIAYLTNQLSKNQNHFDDDNDDLSANDEDDNNVVVLRPLSVSSLPPIIPPSPSPIKPSSSPSALVRHVIAATTGSVPSNPTSSTSQLLLSMRFHLASSVYTLGESVYSILRCDGLSLPPSSRDINLFHDAFFKQTGPSSSIRSYLSLITHTLKQFVSQRSLSVEQLTTEEIRIIVRSLGSDVMCLWDEKRRNDVDVDVGIVVDQTIVAKQLSGFMSIISQHNTNNISDNDSTAASESTSSISYVRKILPIIHSSSSLDSGAGPKEYWTIVSPASAVIRGQVASLPWSDQVSVDDVVDHIKRIAMLIHSKTRFPLLSLGKSQKHRKMADLKLYQLILIGTFEQCLLA